MDTTTSADVVAVVDGPSAATLVRLAAVAGVGLTCRSTAELPVSWRAPAAVVLDEQSARSCVEARLPRRDNVLVVTATSQVRPGAWRDALALGADAVLCLDDEALVAQWFADRAEPTDVGRLILCLSARGGAGASTLAAALGLAASRDADVLLLDADPHAGGIDYLLGLESVPGARWPELSAAVGMLAAAALADALPAVGRLRVLAARRDGDGEQAAGALACVVEAGLRGHAMVVADADRSGSALPLLASYAAVTVLVVPCEVRSAVAAAALVEGLAPRCGDIRLVARPGPADLRPGDVAEAVGRPVMAVWPWERRLAAVVERGAFRREWRRARVGALAASLLPELGR